MTANIAAMSRLISRRRAMVVPLFGLAVMAGASTSASAQIEGEYPRRAITLVVPFPPGGSTDIAARAVAPKLAEKLGATVLIDNRPGAGTAVGAGVVAKATADGYTLLMAAGSTLTLNPAIRKILPYDSIKSYEPIGLVSRASMVLLTNSQVPVKDLREFVNLVKQNPDKYSYGSFGAGTSSHFAAAMAMHAVGVNLMHVPYKGSAPAMVDLMGGQIPFTVDTVTAALPQLKGGKIKPLAVTSAQRSAALPDVPTFKELGYADVNLDSWLALMAPSGTPAAVVSKLEKALHETLKDPALRKMLLDNGLEPTPSSAADVRKLIERELPLMRSTAARANITME